MALAERSHLTNGRFLHSLQQWNAAGGAVYSAGDGDAHYGVAVLPPGSSLSQTFAVDRVRSYTLHIAVKTAAVTITLADGDGNTVLSTTASGSAGVWTETSIVAGLAPGTTYTLALSNAGGSSISVDDVWLWHVVATRAELAARVARQLSALAGDAGLSAVASGSQTEGDYTDAIDAGLRAVGAVDEDTDEPDVRALDAASLDTALAAIERELLKRLQRYYASVVDLKVGQRDEKLSQIGAALRALTAGGGASGSAGKVVTRTLRREARDYELG